MLFAKDVSDHGDSQNFFGGVASEHAIDEDSNGDDMLMVDGGARIGGGIERLDAGSSVVTGALYAWRRGVAN